MPKRKPDPMLPQFQGKPFPETKSTVQEDLNKLRKALFQAICDECGIDVEKATDDERGTANRTVRQILPKGATVEDVHRVALAIMRKNPQLELTPNVMRLRWGKYVNEGPPKLRTVNYGVSTRPEPDDYDENLENIKRIERSERVAELDEAVRNQLAERLRKTVEGSPILLDAWEHRGPWFNTEICKLLDEAK